MKVAAGSQGSRGWPEHGFTMVELLLVMSLLVLILASASLWVRRSMFASAQRPPQEVFLAAAAQARVLAMQQGKSVLLVFDEQAQGFRLTVLDAQTPGGQTGSTSQLPWLENGDSAGLGSSEKQTGDPHTGGQARFFPLSEGSRMRVTFHLLYGEEGITLPQQPEGIRYHPTGVSTPVEVRMEEGGVSGFRLTLVPDHFAGGLRMDGTASANGLSAGGGRR